MSVENPDIVVSLQTAKELKNNGIIDSYKEIAGSSGTVYANIMTASIDRDTLEKLCKQYRITYKNINQAINTIDSL